MGQKLFDQFTFLHFSCGVIAYFLGIDFISWNVLHILFEVVENSETGMYVINNHFTWWPGGKPYADSFQNSVGDIIGGIFGWVIARSLDKYGSKVGWYSPHLA